MAGAFRQRLTRKQCSSVTKQVDDSGFWELPPEQADAALGLDGSTMRLEAHDSSRDHVVTVWEGAPAPFRDTCEYLANLVGMKLP